MVVVSGDHVVVVSGDRGGGVDADGSPTDMVERERDRVCVICGLRLLDPSQRLRPHLFFASSSDDTVGTTSSWMASSWRRNGGDEGGRVG